MGTPLNGSILKGFAILDLFTESRTTITTKTVMAELGANTATAHRLLATLVQAGALVSYERGSYALSTRIERLGKLSTRANMLGQIAQPVIENLSSALNESVMVCRLSEVGPVCVGVSTSMRPISVNIKTGTVLPLHASAQGKLWLANLTEVERKRRLGNLTLDRLSANTITDFDRLEQELETIEQQGYAQNAGENESDIGAVSVPIYDNDGSMVLSMSAFGMLSRFNDDMIDQTRQKLQRAANEIEASFPK